MDDQMGNTKPKFQGDWSCSKCGTAITELPFKPDPERLNQLKCFDCHKKMKGASGRGGNSNREWHEGSWTCSMCGNAINRLPFKPTNDEGLKCIDCFRSNQSA